MFQYPLFRIILRFPRCTSVTTSRPACFNIRSFGSSYASNTFQLWYNNAQVFQYPLFRIILRFDGTRIYLAKVVAFQYPLFRIILRFAGDIEYELNARLFQYPLFRIILRFFHRTAPIRLVYRFNIRSFGSSYASAAL